MKASRTLRAWRIGALSTGEAFEGSKTGRLFAARGGSIGTLLGRDISSKCFPDEDDVFNWCCCCNNRIPRSLQDWSATEPRWPLVDLCVRNGGFS